MCVDYMSRFQNHSIGLIVIVMACDDMRLQFPKMFWILVIGAFWQGFFCLPGRVARGGSAPVF